MNLLSRCFSLNVEFLMFFILSCLGRSRFKLGEVDGSENYAIKLTFKPDISQVIDQISLQVLPLITNNCKDCKYVCLYIFLAVMDISGAKSGH